MTNKILKLAAILAACGTICGATIKLLGYNFVDQNTFKMHCEDNTAKIQKTEIDQTRVIQKLDDVSSDLKEIKRVLLHK